MSLYQIIHLMCLHDFNEFCSALLLQSVHATKTHACCYSPPSARYSLVPVVPKSLLDFLQLPSTFIMGVHDSCTKDLPAMVQAHAHGWLMAGWQCD